MSTSAEACLVRDIWNGLSSFCAVDSGLKDSYMPSPKQNLSWVCSPTLWSLAFNSLAPLCYSICFLVLPHFTAVRWYLTLPGSRCWEKPVPKQQRLWETQAPGVLPAQSWGQDRLRCHTSVVVLSPITRPFWEIIEITHIRGPNYNKLSIYGHFDYAACPLQS